MHYPNTMEIIRSNILLFMGRNKLTISQMAEICDLSEETIKYILNRNPKDCKISTIIKISDAIDISIDELVGRKIKKG